MAERAITVRKFFNTYFNRDDETDPLQVCNYLLVVAALIATVTFQLGVNPPGGFWQEGDHAGRAIYASNKTAFLVFLTCNTLALSWSIFLILSLTWGFPFFLEAFAAMVLMVVTYGAPILAITLRETKTVSFGYLLSIVAVPFLVRIVIQIVKYVRRSLCARNEARKFVSG